jgi:hypothetical protein
MIANLKSIGGEVVEGLESIFALENRTESNELLERWLAFEQYISFALSTHLLA